MHVKIDVNDSFKQHIFCYYPSTNDLDNDVVIADTANYEMIQLKRSN